MTDQELNGLRECLANLVTQYDILQTTDGASVQLCHSGTYSVGQWLGSRMESTIAKARELLAK